MASYAVTVDESVSADLASSSFFLRSMSTGTVVCAFEYAEPADDDFRCLARTVKSVELQCSLHHASGKAERMAGRKQIP